MTIRLAAAFAIGFALLVLPAITAERWLGGFGFDGVQPGHPASLTVRVPPFAGTSTPEAHVRGGGVVIARGEIATPGQVADARAVAAAQPRGAMPFIAFAALLLAFGALFSHHMQRSTRGRLVRVQLISLGAVALFAVIVKAMLLGSALSVLITPVAVFALVPTLALDRIVGIATGVLAALVVALLGPFDVGVAILMLVQAATAGLVVAERPKHLVRATLIAGAVTTVFTAATYLLLAYLTTGRMPSLADPLHSPLLAAAIGPALATAIAVPLIPLYQLLVGEITHGKLVALEDLSNPLLRQIADRAPGTWQHSLMMANMAEIAANAIGANGRLVRVGAYYHDLGKSLSPKYFIENLEAGETSPHDRLPPEISCDAIFAHVTEGIVTARKAGLHERIVDFMHMHHGNGVLEYFWGKTREQGNPRGFTIEQFRYPGHPPQSRETAILAICDAVEAASRTLKKPDAASIDSLVQRIVYGKLHLGQLDESGLSMSDLRQVSDSLRETIRHANHGRIEYPWQKAEQDASASATPVTSTAPRLDSLDRRPAAGESKPAMPAMPAMPVLLPMPERPSEDAFAETARRRRPTRPEGTATEDATEDVIQLVKKTGFDDDTRTPTGDLAIVATARHDEPSERSRATRIGHSPAPEVRVRRGSGEARGDRRAEASASIPSGEVQREAKRDVPSAVEDIRRAVARTRDPGDGTASAVGRRKPSSGPPPAEGSPFATRDGEDDPRTRAAALPRTPVRRAPTVPPTSGPPRTAGPPQPVDLEHAVTHPPPTRRGTSAPPSIRLPGMILESLRLEEEESRVTAPRAIVEPDDDPPTHEITLRADKQQTSPPPNLTRGPASPRERDDAASAAISRGIDQAARASTASGREPDPAPTAPRSHEDVPTRPRLGPRIIEDPSRTEPSMPKFAPPATTPPPLHPNLTLPGHAPGPPSAPWSTGLAARIDAKIDSRIDPAFEDRDEWGKETPVVAPTKAELRSLLGVPDPTRKQSLDELEALHRATTEAEDLAEPEILQRRAPSATAEVDPDDIEAAIEVAPRARQRAPSAIAVAKKPKQD